MTLLAPHFWGAHATRADELYACLVDEAPKVRAGLALAREPCALPR
jgi:hypothetical protein